MFFSASYTEDNLVLMKKKCRDVNRSDAKVWLLLRCASIS